MQNNFLKMKGGSEAIWNFSKNQSILVASPVPDHVTMFHMFSTIYERRGCQSSKVNSDLPFLSFNMRQNIPDRPTNVLLFTITQSLNILAVL